MTKRVKHLEELQLLRTNRLDKEYDAIWADIAAEISLNEVLKDSVLLEELPYPYV